MGQLYIYICKVTAFVLFCNGCNLFVTVNHSRFKIKPSYWWTGGQLNPWWKKNRCFWYVLNACFCCIWYRKVSCFQFFFNIILVLSAKRNTAFRNHRVFLKSRTFQDTNYASFARYRYLPKNKHNIFVLNTYSSTTPHTT